MVCLDTVYHIKIAIRKKWLHIVHIFYEIVLSVLNPLIRKVFSCYYLFKFWHLQLIIWSYTESVDNN